MRTTTENNRRKEPDITAILRRHSQYGEWTEGSIAALGRLAQCVDYRKGELIDMNSLNGGTVFLIDRGVFELVVTIADGRDQCLGYAHPGSMMGLMVEAAVNSSSLPAPARVAGCLLAATEHHARTGLWSSRTLASYSMVQTQLVRTPGLSRQSAGTVLRDFANEGLIPTARQKIELLSLDGLRNLVKRTALPPAG